jgi:hypothetical protein
MVKRMLPYQEGTWFAVPLRDSGYALGLVARSNDKGIALGYFFGPKHNDIPRNENISRLRPEDAILIRLFGDLGLIQGKWPVICHDPAWNRTKWPLPHFGKIAADKSRAIMVQYSEENINKEVQEQSISVEEAQRLPEDGLSGYGAIEIRLTRLLRD